MIHLFDEFLFFNDYINCSIFYCSGRAVVHGNLCGWEGGCPWKFVWVGGRLSMEICVGGRAVVH